MINLPQGLYISLILINKASNVVAWFHFQTTLVRPRYCPLIVCTLLLSWGLTSILYHVYHKSAAIQVILYPYTHKSTSMLFSDNYAFTYQHLIEYGIAISFVYDKCTMYKY